MRMIDSLGRGLAIVAALLLVGCGGGGGGSSGPAAPPADPGSGTPPPTDQALADPAIYSSAASASLASADELAAVTHHRLAAGSATLAYTATAGHLTARDLVTGAPEASFFYVAYTLDNQDSRTRPVTFFYNGGPGSASVWLHLGSFGPKRLATGVPSTAAPTPFPLVANAETLLDASDLVFVDAVGSGLSEAIAPNANETFWGVDADAAVFRDFVIRYIDVNGRRDSPKFLFGESYGTTRSAVLAYLLESAGVSLDGVVLQSSVLDYNANCGVIVAPISCAGYVPTYSATGAWYNLDNPNPTPAALPDFLVPVRTFATERYEPAALAYIAHPAPVGDAALLAMLAAVTGMPAANWQANINLGPAYFQRNLVPGTLFGRYDARISAPFGSPLARGGDPSNDFVAPSFTATIADYLGSELRYTNPSSYTMIGQAADSWNFRHDHKALPDTIPDLGAALALNPRLKVLAVSGYHDLATPFFQTERDLARLGASANVQVRSYVGGHMTYLDDGARTLQKADLVAFYRSTGGAP
jgi:carboxypeptidase C (cathepsin A)